MARVTEITQEWLIQCNKQKNVKYDNKRINDERAGQNCFICSIVVSPAFGQEFAKAEFWTMAWKENWNIVRFNEYNFFDPRTALSINL